MTFVLHLHMRHTPHSGLFIAPTSVVRMSWTSLWGQRDHLQLPGDSMTKRARILGVFNSWVTKYENQNAPIEQNLPMKNAVDTSTLIYPRMVDPCSRSPTNTAPEAMKSSFYCMGKKNKSCSARRYTRCLYSQPRAHISHQFHLKYWALLPPRLRRIS